MENEQFHHVAPWKFIVLSLLTFGLYQLYWFYKCWQYIRKEEGTKIWPFWRAVFAPFWAYSLSKRIYPEAEKNFGASMAFLYMAFSTFERLPEPYDLLSFISFLPLLPFVFRIDLLNRQDGVIGTEYRRIRARSAVLCCICAPILAYTFLATLSFIPNTRIVEGTSLYSFHERFFKSIGTLDEGEEVLYFYSTAMFSFKADGNFLTEKRVVSYWREPGSDETYVNQATYPEIEAIDVNFSSSSGEDSVVTITCLDGTEFILYLSTELGRDHDFCEALNHYWQTNNARGLAMATDPSALYGRRIRSIFVSISTMRILNDVSTWIKLPDDLLERSIQPT